MNKIPINIYYRLMSGHVHMRVFIFGGLVGNLIMNEKEFHAFSENQFDLNFFEEDEKPAIKVN